MSYLTQDAIASNPAMQHRVAQCAAREGVGVDPEPADPFNGRPMDPDRWAIEHRRTWAASPGWDAAWASALAGSPDKDPGENEACITDGQILAQVQAML